MKKDREARAAARMGLKRSSGEAVAQYGKGLAEGMRIAYLAVIKRCAGLGWREEAIRSFMSAFLAPDELESLMKEAAKK